MNVKPIKILLLCLLSLGIFSCSDEDHGLGGGQEQVVTISLSVPDMGHENAPATYAMPGDEATINSVDVLVFKTDPAYPGDPGKGTYYYRATVGHTAGSSTFTARFIEAPVNQTIVVLANCRQQVNTLLGTIVEGASKASVIQALSLTRTVGFDPATMTGIPMWGEITNQNITASYNPLGLSIALTRMLARINIVNTDHTNFTLQQAFLYNPRGKGSVIPDNWDGLSSVTTPTAVSGAQMTQGTPFGPYTASAYNKIENTIYTFEADNKAKAGGDLLDATCLVVGGQYQGNTVYYRIDLKNYTTNAYFDVLRNHSYNVTITSVPEEGADTADEAYRGTTKIKATVEPWNMATGDVQISASHLYVSNRHPWLKLDGTTEPYTGSKVLKIKTTDPAGWHWKNDPATNATLAAFNVTTAGGATGSEVTVQWSPGVGSAAGRDGKAIIVSGNLEYTLTFIQDDCGRSGIPLAQRIGTRDYKTHRYGSDCWMVENSMEGTGNSKGFGLDWNGADSGTIDDGDPSDRGNLNGYYYTFYQATTPPPLNNACPCPTGWHLPTKSEWMTRNSASPTPIYIDEYMLWWGGANAPELINPPSGWGRGLGRWLAWGELAVYWVATVPLNSLFPSVNEIELDLTATLIDEGTPSGGHYRGGLLSVRCVQD